MRNRTSAYMKLDSATPMPAQSRQRRILIPQGAGMSTASLSKACTDCSAYLRGVRGYSVDTLGNYERTWHQFMHYLHGQGCSDEVRHFTVERVMDWCADLGTRGIHPNTIRNKIAGLSTLARFLMKRRDGRGRPLLTENPCHGFEKPRAVQQETKFMHPE